MQLTLATTLVVGAAFADGGTPLADLGVGTSAPSVVSSSVLLRSENVYSAVDEGDNDLDRGGGTADTAAVGEAEPPDPPALPREVEVEGQVVVEGRNLPVSIIEHEDNESQEGDALGAVVATTAAPITTTTPTVTPTITPTTAPAKVLVKMTDEDFKAWVAASAIHYPSARAASYGAVQVDSAPAEVAVVDAKAPELPSFVEGVDWGVQNGGDSSERYHQVPVRPLGSHIGVESHAPLPDAGFSRDEYLPRVEMMFQEPEPYVVNSSDYYFGAGDPYGYPYPDVRYADARDAPIIPNPVDLFVKPWLDLIMPLAGAQVYGDGLTSPLATPLNSPFGSAFGSLSLRGRKLSDANVSNDVEGDGVAAALKGIISNVGKAIAPAFEQGAAVALPALRVTSSGGEIPVPEFSMGITPGKLDPNPPTVEPTVPPKGISFVNPELEVPVAPSVAEEELAVPPSPPSQAAARFVVGGEPKDTMPDGTSAVRDQDPAVLPSWVFSKDYVAPSDPLQAKALEGVEVTTWHLGGEQSVDAPSAHVEAGSLKSGGGESEPAGNASVEYVAGANEFDARGLVVPPELRSVNEARMFLQAKSSDTLPWLPLDGVVSKVPEFMLGQMGRSGEWVSGFGRAWRNASEKLDAIASSIAAPIMALTPGEQEPGVDYSGTQGVIENNNAPGETSSFIGPPNVVAAGLPTYRRSLQDGESGTEPVSWSARMREGAGTAGESIGVGVRNLVTSAFGASQPWRDGRDRLSAAVALGGLQSHARSTANSSVLGGPGYGPGSSYGGAPSQTGQGLGGAYGRASLRTLSEVPELQGLTLEDIDTVREVLYQQSAPKRGLLFDFSDSSSSSRKHVHHPTHPGWYHGPGSMYMPPGRPGMGYYSGPLHGPPHGPPHGPGFLPHYPGPVYGGPHQHGPWDPRMGHWGRRLSDDGDSDWVVVDEEGSGDAEGVLEGESIFEKYGGNNHNPFEQIPTRRATTAPPQRRVPRRSVPEAVALSGKPMVGQADDEYGGGFVMVPSQGLILREQAEAYGPGVDGMQSWLPGWLQRQTSPVQTSTSSSLSTGASASLETVSSTGDSKSSASTVGTSTTLFVMDATDDGDMWLRREGPPWARHPPREGLSTTTASATVSTPPEGGSRASAPVSMSSEGSTTSSYPSSLVSSGSTSSYSSTLVSSKFTNGAGRDSSDRAKSSSSTGPSPSSSSDRAKSSSSTGPSPSSSSSGSLRAPIQRPVVRAVPAAYQDSTRAERLETRASVSPEFDQESVRMLLQELLYVGRRLDRGVAALVVGSGKLSERLEHLSEFLEDVLGDNCSPDDPTCVDCNPGESPTDCLERNRKAHPETTAAPAVPAASVESTTPPSGIGRFIPFLGRSTASSSSLPIQQGFNPFYPPYPSYGYPPPQYPAYQPYPGLPQQYMPQAVPQSVPEDVTGGSPQAPPRSWTKGPGAVSPAPAPNTRGDGQVTATGSAPVPAAEAVAVSAVSDPVAAAEPVAVSDPVAAAEPAPVSVPVAAAEPAPVSVPEPTAESAPVSAPVPAVEQAPVSVPEPAAESAPVSAPVPAAEQAPVSVPEPAAESAPVSALVRAVEPVAAASQVAAAEPALVSDPVPAAGPALVSDPVAAATHVAGVAEGDEESAPPRQLDADGVVGLMKSGLDYFVARVKDAVNVGDVSATPASSVAALLRKVSESVLDLPTPSFRDNSSVRELSTTAPPMLSHKENDGPGPFLSLMSYA